MNLENACKELNAMLREKQNKIRQEAVEEFKKDLVKIIFELDISNREYEWFKNYIESYNLPTKE